MTYKSKTQRIGPLDCLVVGATPQPKLTIVVFHGFGANCTDLVSLSRLIAVPAGTQWVFPDGPIEVSDGGIDGRAWFPLDTEALDRAMRAGTYRDFSKDTPEGLKRARLQAMEMWKALNVPMAQTIFMGFSQGAMLATDVALRAETSPKALIVLSGALLNESLWMEKAKLKTGMSFFASHGANDQLLSLDSAVKLEKLLTDAGLKGKLHAFKGGHEIPQQIIFDLGKFLTQVWN